MCLFSLFSSTSFASTIQSLIVLGLNTYCIMLQRYNCIRMNQVIKKMTTHLPGEPKGVREQELEKEDTFTMNHTNKKKEATTTAEDFIETANLEQLKQYRAALSHFQMIEQDDYERDHLLDDRSINVDAPIEKKKSFKTGLKS